MTDLEKRDIRIFRVREFIGEVLGEHIDVSTGKSLILIIAGVIIEYMLKNKREYLRDSDLKYMESLKEHGIMYCETFYRKKITKAVLDAVHDEGINEFREHIKDAVIDIKEADITIYHEEDNAIRNAVYNYNKIISSRNHSEVLFKLMCNDNSHETLSRITCDNIMTALESEVLSRELMFEILKIVCMSNYIGRIDNLTGEEHKLYEEHMKLGYKYIAFLMNDNISIDMIKKVHTWTRMFEGTDKMDNVMWQGRYVGAYIQELKYSDKERCPIDSVSRVVWGIEELYKLEAHKLTDEAIKRYEILK